MAAQLHILGQTRLIDTNGIADGAEIYFYLTGTLTPTPVYTDDTLATEHSSPIVVAAGAAVPAIYLDSSITYRRRIVYPDGSVDDTDPYTGLAASGVTSSDGSTVQAKFDTLEGADGADNVGVQIPRPYAQVSTLGAGIREINVRRDYGAIGDGFSHPLSSRFATLAEAQAVYPHALALTDEIDWCAIQGALNDAQVGGSYRLSTVYIGEGWFIINRGLKFKQANNAGVALVGHPFAPLRQGSTIAACLISYTGSTAEPIIESRGTYNKIEYLAIDNRGAGAATSAIKLTGPTEGAGGGRNILNYVAVIEASSTNSYTRALVEMNTTDYSYFTYCNFTGDDVPLLLFDNANSAIGATKLTIDKCFMSLSGSGAFAPHIKIKDGSLECLNIFDSAFITGFTNREACVIDCSEIDNGTNGSAPQHIDVLNFVGNEVEFTTNSTLSNVMRLKNVYQANLRDNQFMNDNGVAPLVATLTTSRANVSGNFFRGWPGESATTIDKGLFKKNDSTSRVYLGPNRREAGAGAWIERNSFTTQAVTPQTTSTTGKVNLFIQGDKGSPDRNTTFKYTATTADALDVYVAQPGETVGGYMAPGQMFTVEIANNSGGAIGAITLAGTRWKAGGALTAPANGFRRSWTFEWDGYFAVERFRTAADVTA